MINSKPILRVKYLLQAFTCGITALSLMDTNNIHAIINHLAIGFLVLLAIELAARGIAIKESK